MAHHERLSKTTGLAVLSSDPLSSVAYATEEIRRDWERWGEGTPLVVRNSPYRSLMEPLLDYIEEVDAERPDNFVTVVLPEFVPSRFWHHLLHNQRALLIKAALLFRPNTIVISVPVPPQGLRLLDDFLIEVYSDFSR